MDIGTGILTGCAIIGGVVGTVRLFPKNNKNVSQKQFDMLNETMRDGFFSIKEDIKGLHKRVDKILEK